MMNSSAPGEDGDFPPNPFRSGQPQQQADFFSTEAAPAFAAPPPVAAPPPAPQQTAYPTATVAQTTGYTVTTIPGAAQAPYSTPPPAVPQGSMEPVNNNGSAPNAPQSRWQACMSCFRMETYMAYYDVDTAEILQRLKFAVLYFYHPDKFRSEIIGAARTDSLKGPDLYGPLWITMTLVFFVAVTSNLSAYIRTDPEEFEYDISHLVRAMTVCFGFVFGVPTLWWLVTQCMGLQALMLVDWVCLYGYSMLFYLPATVLCLMPFHIGMWIVLAVATACSALLVVRNVAAPLLGADAQANKAAPVLLAVLASHVIFLLVLKLAFYE